MPFGFGCCAAMMGPSGHVLLQRPSCSRCANKGNLMQLSGSEPLPRIQRNKAAVFWLIRFFSFHEFGWRARAEPNLARAACRSDALSGRVALVATKPSFPAIVRSPRPAKRQPLPPPVRRHPQRPLLPRLGSRRRRPRAVQRLVGRPHQGLAIGRRERKAGTGTATG